MFSPGYFSTSYFSSSYFATGGITEENTSGKYRGKLPKKKRIEIKHDLIDSLIAFYGESETKPDVITEVIPEVVEQFEEVIPQDFDSDLPLSFETQFDLLDSKVEMDAETRAELERTQDIGLILAIIECI